MNTYWGNYSASCYRASHMAWSPDSRWLFIAGDHLRAINSATGRIYEIGTVPGGPTLNQVVVRPAASSS